MSDGEDDGAAILLESLRWFASLSRPHDGYAYTGPYDFVVRHGRAYRWSPLPPDVRLGPRKRCFDNSFTYAIRDPERWRYVEGYAGFVHLHHAWLIDRETGLVVDRTWRRNPKGTVPTHYIGVEFPFAVVAALAVITQQQGGFIDAWEKGHPLLRIPWDVTDPQAYANRLRAAARVPVGTKKGRKVT